MRFIKTQGSILVVKAGKDAPLVVMGDNPAQHLSSNSIEYWLSQFSIFGERQVRPELDKYSVWRLDELYSEVSTLFEGVDLTQANIHSVLQRLANIFATNVSFFSNFISGQDGFTNEPVMIYAHTEMSALNLFEKGTEEYFIFEIMEAAWQLSPNGFPRMTQLITPYPLVWVGGGKGLDFWGRSYLQVLRRNVVMRPHELVQKFFPTDSMQKLQEFGLVPRFNLAEVHPNTRIVSWDDALSWMFAANPQALGYHLSSEIQKYILICNYEVNGKEAGSPEYMTLERFLAEKNFYS